MTTPGTPLHVVVSHLEAAEDGEEVLEQAFADRLGEVEGFPGFVRLEVWREDGAPGRYAMVTWWRSAEDFRAYMRSAQHRRSHARIPQAPFKPRARGLQRYTRVAE